LQGEQASGSVNNLGHELESKQARLKPCS
jgi:hypothetical protein